jgi:hypothetical protein
MIKDINIYYLCPDSNTPQGGVKVIYEHVDLLNGAGFSAYVLHHKKGFRCNWFDNSTAIAYQKKSTLNDTDYIVIPEIYDKYFAGNNPKSKKAKIFWQIYQTPCHKIIFNQHSYNTFKGQSLSQKNFRTIYNDKQIRAVMVVSEDNRRYLSYFFLI